MSIAPQFGPVLRFALAAISLTLQLLSYSPRATLSGQGRALAEVLARSNDELRRVTSEGEGACSPLFKIRSHLPLRGKLGWMTPRVGVKTTLTIERATPGLLFPSKGPTFLPNAFSGGIAPSASR